MMSEQETSLAPPCSNLRSLRVNVLHCRKICDIVGTFQRPAHCGSPRYAHDATFRGKVRSCEIRKALNVKLLPHERLARQVLLVKPTGKRRRFRPRLRRNNCISDLAWSRLGVEPVKLPEIAVDLEVFRVLATLPGGKTSMKTNEI